MKRDIISQLEAAGLKQSPGIDWPIAHFDGGGAAGDGGAAAGDGGVGSGASGGGGNEYAGDTGPSRPSDAVRFALPKPKTPLYTGKSLLEQVQNSNPGMKANEAQAVAQQLYKSGVTDLNATQAYGYADKQIEVTPAVFNNDGDEVTPATYRAPTAADIRPEYSTDLLTAKGDPVPTSFDLGNHYTASIGVGADGSIKPAVSYQAPSHGFFGDLFAALGPVGPLVMAVVAPELLPYYSVASGVAQGQDLGSIVKNAGLSAIGANIAGGISGGLADTLGSTGANLAGRALSSEIMSGGKTDLGKLLTNAAISGGIGQLTNTGPSASDLTEGYFAPGGEGYIAPEEPTAPVTVPTQAEQQPAVDDFIKQIEQYQAPEPTVEQIMASEPPPAVAPAAPVEEPTDTVQALLDSQQPAPTNQAEIDQQTQDLLSSLSGGTDNGTSDNGTPANDQAEWDVPVAPSELQTALDNLPQEQAEWDVPVNPDDLNTALTEIAAPEPNDTPSPTEQDVLDFMKEHPDAVAGTATRVAAGKAVAAKTAAAEAASDKATADKAAADKAVADKAAASVPVQQYMPSVGDVAHIKSLESLFGPLLGTLPAEPAHEKKDDSLSVLEDMDQEYASGGHVDDFSVEALLHILRS